MEVATKLKMIRWAAFAWALLIAWLSTGGGIQLPPTWLDAIGPDKVGHLTVYGVLTVLVLWGFGGSPGQKRRWWLLVLAVCLYGLALECIQYWFYPNRYFEVFDLIANITGALIGRWFALRKLPTTKN